MVERTRPLEKVVTLLRAPSGNVEVLTMMTGPRVEGPVQRMGGAPRLRSGQAPHGAKRR